MLFFHACVDDEYVSHEMSKSDSRCLWLSHGWLVGLSFQLFHFLNFIMVTSDFLPHGPQVHGGCVSEGRVG